MNYTKLYDAVIAKAVFRKKPEGYCEKHHIVPRCMGGANGKDNLVLFFTERYPEQPLVIKGAGAGAEVTASGVFADIIRVARV